MSLFHADDVGRVSITRIVPQYSLVVVSADDHFKQVQNRIDVREKSDSLLSTDEVLEAQVSPPVSPEG